MMGPRGSLGFDERISALDECTPNMFIAVVEAILKVQVPGVYRDPTTIDGAFPAHRAADPLVSRPCLHLRPCLQCRACAPFAHALHCCICCCTVCTRPRVCSFSAVSRLPACSA